MLFYFTFKQKESKKAMSVCLSPTKGFYFKSYAIILK